MNVRNNEIYDALLKYTVKMLQEVENYLKTNALIKISDFTWIKTKEGHFSRGLKELIHWPASLHKLQFQEFEEYQECVAIMKEDKLFNLQIDNMVGTVHSRRRIQIDSVLNSIALEILNKNDAPFFNIETFNEQYSILENFFYEDEILAEKITPLYGFESELDSIILDDNVSIRMLTDEEIITFLNLGYKMGEGIADSIFKVSRHAIIINKPFPKIIGDKKESSADESFLKGEFEERLIQCLRLTKEGFVYPLGTMTNKSTPFGQSYAYNYKYPSKSAVFHRYTISKKEADELDKNWNLMKNAGLDGRHFLKIGINRFSQASERQNPEDTIIDLLISSEALFLNEISPSGELMYRLALRASFFLEEETEKRRKIFKFFKDLYKVRNNIVHGSSKSLKLPKKEDGNRYSLQELCKEAEASLRYAYQKALALANDKDVPEYLLDWDDLVFQ